MAPVHTLGIDFGTSNSAAGLSVNGQPWLIELEPGEDTLPTAAFFDPHTKAMHIGHRAVRSLIAGDEGRFMRALKSLLGTSLLHEKRRLGGKEMTFADIITYFLAELKKRAEAATGLEFASALSGRPVYFHSSDPARNAAAEDDLRSCYLAAGFQDVRFMYEPEAALRATDAKDGLGLVVDIGGGTSDFTLFSQHVGARPNIIASHGLRLGGTDFDRRISIDHVMPLFGRQSDIRNSFGPGTLPAPARIFNDLATWQMIPFLYAPETRRLAKDLLQFAVEPDKLKRLVDILEYELGHEVAFATERGKISANRTPDAETTIQLGFVESGLNRSVSQTDLQSSLDPLASEMVASAHETLVLGQARAHDITDIVLVGGSSLMNTVQNKLAAAFPNARLASENALTAVASGLALASADT